jgi:HEAT repeat protein
LKDVFRLRRPVVPSLGLTAFQINGENPKAIKLKYSCRIIAEAGHRGDQQLVRDALGADDPAARSAALGAALRLEILDYKMLTTALDDPSARVRRRAVELAARVAPGPGAPGSGRVPGSGGPGGLTARDRAGLADRIAGLLGDPDCGEVAAYALGELGLVTGAVVAGLELQASQHPDPLHRESAVAALGALGAGRESVLAAVGDVATVRRRAVIALAGFDGPEVERALEAALGDRDWQVRQAAEDLLRPPPDT